MTFFERVPVPAEIHEEDVPGGAVHAFEGRKLEVPAQLLGRYTEDSTRLALRGVQARSQIEALAQEKSPEELTELREKLAALIREAQMALDKIAATSALAGTLAHLVPEAPTEQSVSPEDFAEHPDIAEKTLEGVVEVGGRNTAHKELVMEAESALVEIRNQKRLKKLSLKLAQRIIRIGLDAFTYGIGGAVIDTAMDIAQAFKHRNEVAA